MERDGGRLAREELEPGRSDAGGHQVAPVLQAARAENEVLVLGLLPEKLLGVGRARAERVARIEDGHNDIRRVDDLRRRADGRASDELPVSRRAARARTLKSSARILRLWPASKMPTHGPLRTPRARPALPPPRSGAPPPRHPSRAEDQVWAACAGPCAQRSERRAVRRASRLASPCSPCRPQPGGPSAACAS
eukprot:scaffold236423_cov27-Tisochrysis_lutea.AAC.2